MKKIFLVTLVAVFFTMLLSVTTMGQLLTEQFNYTADATNGLFTQSSGAWELLNTGDSILVGSGNLSYTGLPSSVGNKIKFDGAGSDARRSFTSQTSGTVYCSFILNVTGLGSLNTTGGYFAGFIQGTTTNFGSTTWLRLDGSGFNIGVNPRTTPANTAWAAGTMSINTSYFIVISYEIVSGTINDIVKLWVNPTLGLGSEPAVTSSATNTGTDLTSVDRILLRQDAAAATPFIEMDEMRITTAWADAALPIELVSFTALARGSKVELNWATATEVSSYGFEVERNAVRVSGFEFGENSNHEPQNSNQAWVRLGFVEGHGTTNAPQFYSFVDLNVRGTVVYRLKQIDRDGKFEYSGQVEVTAAEVSKFVLSQNHPNPFNPSTIISYELPVRGYVSLKVYDMLGKEVATLVNGEQAPGVKQVEFNASHLSSGIYFYALRSGNFVETKKMLMVK